MFSPNDIIAIFCVFILDLRLDLLDGHHNTELVQALYGLLMLLPQSEGFHVLQRRLNCVPSFHLPRK